MKKRYLRMVRSALRSLRHPRLRHREWWKILTKPIADRALWIPCRDSVATGIAIGAFFSMIPMPLQMIPAALISIRAKANIPFAMAACWITNPITVGPIIWMQYRLGSWMRSTLNVPMPNFLSSHPFKVPEAGINFMLGMTVSAVLCALLAYPLVHLFSAIMPQHLPVKRKKKEASITPPEE